MMTYVRVAMRTEDLLQEGGEGGEEGDPAPETEGQDPVGSHPHQLSTHTTTSP